MPRAKKKKFELSDAAKEDLRFMKQYEPFYTEDIFKMRIFGMAGYRIVRLEMVDATEEQWKDVYNLYKG